MTDYTQAMTFADLYGEVLALRFDGSRDATETQAKRWVNSAYQYLWNLEEWNFKYMVATDLHVTSGSDQLGNLPSGFGATWMTNGLWRSDGQKLAWQEPDEFQNNHANQDSTGSPSFFTVINGAIYVDPISSDTAVDYVGMFEKGFSALVADTDVPAIPSDFHYLIVPGTLQIGLPLYSDFTFQFLGQQWQDGITTMRRTCLSDQRGAVRQFGRDSVEALPTFWGV